MLWLCMASQLVQKGDSFPCANFDIPFFRVMAVLEPIKVTIQNIDKVCD